MISYFVYAIAFQITVNISLEKQTKLIVRQIDGDALDIEPGLTIRLPCFIVFSLFATQIYNSTDSARFKFFKLNFYPFYYSVMQSCTLRLIFFSSFFVNRSVSNVEVVQQKLQRSKMLAISNEQIGIINFFSLQHEKPSRKSQLKASNDRMSILYFGTAISTIYYFYLFLSLKFLRASLYVSLRIVRLFVNFFSSLVGAKV